MRPRPLGLTPTTVVTAKGHPAFLPAPTHRHTATRHRQLTSCCTSSTTTTFCTIALLPLSDASAAAACLLAAPFIDGLEKRGSFSGEGRRRVITEYVHEREQPVSAVENPTCCHVSQSVPVRAWVCVCACVCVSLCIAISFSFLSARAPQNVMRGRKWHNIFAKLFARDWHKLCGMNS